MSELALFTGCTLAIVFVASATLKMASLPAFYQAVHDLGGVPKGGLARAAGLCVIGAEYATGVLLVIPGTRRPGFLLSAALLVAFTTVIARALRATAAVHCACFGTRSSAVGPMHLVRNLALLALAAVGLFTPGHGLKWTLAGQLPPMMISAGLLAALLVLMADDLVYLFGHDNSGRPT